VKAEEVDVVEAELKAAKILMLMLLGMLWKLR